MSDSKTTECSQSTCTEKATWSYVWPGKPDRCYACDDCMRKATAISEAMGFRLGDIRSEPPAKEAQRDE